MLTIIIPYRNRLEHLNEFIKSVWPNIKSIIPNSRLVIVEQDNDLQFNRGLLLNIGFKEYMENTDFFITHDVDLLPSKDIINNYYKKNDYDIIRILNGHSASLGGICKFKKEVIQDINGFPNYLWGWGIEDRALYYRAKHKKATLSEWTGVSLKKHFYCLNHKSNVRDYIGEKLKISNYINEISDKDEAMDNEIKSSGINNVKYSIKEKNLLLKDVYHLKVNFTESNHKFQKNILKIAYINYWKDSDTDQYFTKFIQNNLVDFDVKTVNINENHDILISSNMGQNISLIQKSNAKIKIFFTGENLNRKEYKFWIDNMHIFDIVLGFNKTDVSKNILRFPLWLIYYSFYSWSNTDNILNFIQKEYDTNIRYKKALLSTCIARHDRGGQRSHICNIIENYKPNNILYPSDFRNNCKKLDLGVHNKKSFLKNVVFSVCPENSSSELYHTEKIFHAFEGGTIPIYWAKDKPEKELINENSYIFCNIDNSDISKIKSAIDNPSKFVNQNIFKSQGKYIIDNYYESLRWMIKKKLDIIPKQKIYGISYASRHFKNRFNKINLEGKNCGFFDNFQCYDETNIDKDFKDRLKEVWNMSKRGGGYWIWKPKIILDKLKQINENDILVYIDSGCTINNTQTSKMRFNDYINMVNSHWTGFLRFQLTHRECDFSNKYSIQYLTDYFGADFNDYVDSNQLMATVLVIRKNKFTMDFFSKNLEIVEKNPYILTDIYTKENEKHRHDQSLMSLLYKYMNGSLILKDETWFGVNTGNFGSINSKKYPFWATRLKN